MPAGANERDPGNDEEAERNQLPRGEHRCRARTSWVRRNCLTSPKARRAAIESIQTSAIAGPITGSVASKKQPTFEQLSLENILLLHWQKDLAGSSRFILTSQAVAGRHRRGLLNPSYQPSVT
jgi:hypothetical protein